MKNPHAGRALWLELPGNRSIFLECPSREDFAEVCKLDLAPGAHDTPLALVSRMIAQLAMIFAKARWSSAPGVTVGEMAPLTAIEAASITVGEAREIFHAWVAQAIGCDPVQAVNLQAVLARTGSLHPWDHWTLGEVRRALEAGSTP